MTTQSFRIGDVVSAKNVDKVPEWSCVQDSSEDHIWRRVGDRWQTVGFGITVPSYPLRKASGDGSVVAVERCIVGLRCTATTRADLGRELAAQGWAPAVEWLRRHGLGAFKVGDNLTKEQVRDLPVGAVIERDDYPWQREADGWRPCGVVDGDDPPLIRAMYETSGPGRLIALGVRVGNDRAAFRRALAEQGYEPARRALAERTPNVAPVAHDDFVQATAPLVYGPPSIGTELTPEQIRYLPVGAVVAKDERWGYQRLEGDHWRVVLIGPRQSELGDELDPGRARDASWLENVRGRLIALNAPQGREYKPFLLALAGQGWKPARQALHLAPSVSVKVDTSAVQDALGRLADEMATLTPPLPAVGEIVAPEMLDRPPAGAVVDTQDGTNTPWAIKCEDGWDYIGRKVLLGSRWFASASRLRAVLPRWRPTLIALDAPPRPGEALRAWCAERGYECAIVIERELTEQQVRKQIIDERNAPPQNQEMATSTTQITTQAGTYIQRPEENAPAFLARIAAGGVPDVQSTTQRAPLIFSDEKTQPSALTRFVDAFKGIGADFAKDGVKAVVDSKALVLVDGSRLALHGAAAQIAEWVGGESAAEKVQRATQNPLAAGIEDVLVVIGATLTGQQGLAAAVRGRVVRRIVDGAEGAIVAKGAAVVTQLAQAAKALGAASAAAELPAESTATQTEGEVQS